MKAKDVNGCKYHDDCLTCPFAICVIEFPGGGEAYFRYQETLQALEQGLDLNQAAELLDVQRQALRRRLNKGARYANKDDVHQTQTV